MDDTGSTTYTHTNTAAIQRAHLTGHCLWLICFFRMTDEHCFVQSKITFNLSVWMRAIRFNSHVIQLINVGDNMRIDESNRQTL